MVHEIGELLGGPALEADVHADVPIGGVIPKDRVFTSGPRDLARSEKAAEPRQELGGPVLALFCKSLL